MNNPNTCKHETQEYRRRIYSNGVPHLGIQCLDCGRVVGNAVPFSKLNGKPISEVPLLDEKLRERGEALMNRDLFGDADSIPRIHLDLLRLAERSAKIGMHDMADKMRALAVEMRGNQ